VPDRRRAGPSWDFLPSALPTRFARPTGCVAPCTPASTIAGQSPITTMSPTTSMPCGWTWTWCIPAAISHVIRTCLQHRSFNAHKKRGPLGPRCQSQAKRFRQAQVRFSVVLLHCGQGVDSALARKRICARLQNVIRALLENRPQLRRLHVAVLAYDQGGYAGDMRGCHRGPDREEVEVGGANLSSRTQDKV
jgi:hypothetical protein